MKIALKRFAIFVTGAIILFSFSCSSKSGGKIIIEEFSDFQCPYCARAQETLRELKKIYGDRLEIRFRHFPLGFHKYARQAAKGAECAREQGKFWEMHDLLFQYQANLSSDAINGYAFKIGLDGEKFVECMNSQGVEEVIDRDLEEGKKREIRGTPTFFINGIRLVGAKPLEEFKKVIKEAERKGASKGD